MINPRDFLLDANFDPKFAWKYFFIHDAHLQAALGQMTTCLTEMLTDWKRRNSAIWSIKNIDDLKSSIKYRKIPQQKIRQ
jgi:hypothetical protein